MLVVILIEITYKYIIKGRLAQLVEHLVYTENVGGSRPSPPTICRTLTINKVYEKYMFVALKKE